MKTAMRVSVEWTHAQVKLLWSVADNQESSFKMECEHDAICAQIWLARFFANCVTCCRGNQAATCFGLDPPALHQQLDVVP
jgi:hypothetical protein